eukprot:CAMPEP_0119308284 /NCGR_PEP_ID=MMETSP1333-20130426/9903_1 /TAXON_ID=418940 /ORGANISM="Scyphosphaera apsteinii, Strain RCC1455" /LENGTH=271 /DNA_ID=CAMNT_0007312015 /DNA_START=38 /DNA_END=856 /DNA_ORIENTATION=+
MTFIAGVVCMVVPAVGLQVAARPTPHLLHIWPCASSRCAPPRVLNEEEECVVSDAGSSCISRGSVPDCDVPPPVDEERRRRSPGLQNNFYDISTADFKRPYGASRGAEPPPAPEWSLPAAGDPARTLSGQEPAGFGAETPIPGREKEYEAFKAQTGAEIAGQPTYAPPIDEQRPRCSPGLRPMFAWSCSPDLPKSFGGISVVNSKMPLGLSRDAIPPAPASEGGVLQVRVARLEQSHERLEAALSQARAREVSLLQRLEALEARHGDGGDA